MIIQSHDKTKNIQLCIQLLTSNTHIQHNKARTMSSFLNLPLEIVYRILDHESDKTLFCSMQNVCQRLNKILNTYDRYLVSIQEQSSSSSLLNQSSSEISSNVVKFGTTVVISVNRTLVSLLDKSSFISHKTLKKALPNHMY